MAVRIITDSTSDIPKSIAEELHIGVVPLTVFFGEEAYLDGVDLDNKQFYEKLASSKVLPRTSQPSVEAFTETYQKAIDEGCDSIVSIHLSQKLSGTFNSASLAARDVMQSTKIPIEVVDTGFVSIALGYPTMKAAQAAKEGKSKEEVLTIIQDILPRIYIIAVLDTLEFLHKGGRIGKAQQLLGTLLNVKPMITVKEGAVLPLENVRTRSKAYERITQLISKSGPLEDIAIAESDEEVGNLLNETLKTVYSGQIKRYRLGATLGAHAGPGTAAVMAILKTPLE